MTSDASPLIRANLRHVVSGTLTVEGEPAQRRVVVLDQATLRPVGITVSDIESGAWEVHMGRPRTVTAIGIDDTREFESVVASFIQSVPRFQGG